MQKYSNIYENHRRLSQGPLDSAYFHLIHVVVFLQVTPSHLNENFLTSMCWNCESILQYDSKNDAKHVMLGQNVLFYKFQKINMDL